MSTQYEFMKRQVVEEVAALQEKLIAIQADCINRIKEIPVTSDLEDTMDELLNKISNQFLFQIGRAYLTIACIYIHPYSCGKQCRQYGYDRTCPQFSSGFSQKLSPPFVPSR